MPLITENAVAIRVSQADGKADILEEIIAEAQALADGYCKRVLESASYTEYHDIGHDQAALSLRQYPVTGTLLLYTGTNGNPTLLQTSGVDYLLDTDAGIINCLTGAWPEGPRNVRATYTAGYTAATCPAGLKAALYDLCAFRLEFTGSAGASGESADGYQVTYEDTIAGVPLSIAKLLDPFARRVVLG